jgi:hypothetical protein
MYRAEGLPTKRELAAYKDILETWHSTEHFDNYVRMLGLRIPTEKLWENPYKFVREAMTLNTYAELAGDVVALRLGADPPDGWVRLVTGEEIPVELTEALEPGRKRNDEYKGKQAVEVAEPDPATRIEIIETQLQQAIESKAGKYTPPPALIVYLNMGAYSSPPHEVEAAIARQKAQHEASFDGISVLWQGKAY